MNKQTALPTVTIDDLAIMIAKGFKETDNRFIALEEKMDNKFVALETKMDNKFVTLETEMNNKFGALETKMDNRFDGLETRFDTLTVRVDCNEKTVFKDHEPRLRKMERKLQFA